MAARERREDGRGRWEYQGEIRKSRPSWKQCVRELWRRSLVLREKPSRLVSELVRSTSSPGDRLRTKSRVEMKQRKRMLKAGWQECHRLTLVLFWKTLCWSSKAAITFFSFTKLSLSASENVRTCKKNSQRLMQWSCKDNMLHKQVSL